MLVIAIKKAANHSSAGVYFLFLGSVQSVRDTIYIPFRVLVRETHRGGRITAPHPDGAGDGFYGGSTPPTVSLQL